MNVTVSSMFFALLASSILIVILHYILVNKRSYKKLRIDFLSVIIFIIVIV